MFNDNDEFDDDDDDIMSDVVFPDDVGYNNSVFRTSNNESCRKLFNKDNVKNQIIKDDKKVSTSYGLHNNIVAPASSKYSSDCNFNFEFADDFPVSAFDLDNDLFETQENLATPPDSEFMQIQEKNYVDKHPKEDNKKDDFRSKILKTITNSKNKQFERIEPDSCNKPKVSTNTPDINYTRDFSSRKRPISPDRTKDFITKKQNTGPSKTDGSIAVSSNFACKKNSTNQVNADHTGIQFKNKNVPSTKVSDNYPSTSMVTPIKKTPPGLRSRSTVSPGGPVVCKRKFPGPAGLLPKSGGGRTPHITGQEIKEKKTPSPSFESVVCSQTSSDDFSRGPWQQMLIDLELDPSDPTSPLHVFNIRWITRRASLRGQSAVRKVPFLAVMLRNLDLKSHADATATLKDKTGEINGTIPKCVMEEYGSSLQPGCVLFLKGVSVLSPIGIRGGAGARDSSRRHYLNITLNTILTIYSSDDSGNVITHSLGQVDKRDMLMQAATPKNATTPRAIVEEELEEDMYESASVNNDTLFSNNIVSGSGQNSAQPRLPPYRSPGVQSPAYRTAIRNALNGPRCVGPGMAVNNQRFQSPVSSQRFQGNRMQVSAEINRNPEPRATTSRFIFNPVIKSSTPKPGINNSSITHNQVTTGYRNKIQDEQSSKNLYSSLNNSNVRNRNQSQPSPSPNIFLSQADKNEVSQLFESLDDESIFGDF